MVQWAKLLGLGGQSHINRHAMAEEARRRIQYYTTVHEYC